LYLIAEPNFLSPSVHSRSVTMAHVWNHRLSQNVCTQHMMSRNLHDAWLSDNTR